jgi:EmrB/QacA subfamily drug resistance transporter
MVEVLGSPDAESPTTKPITKPGLVRLIVIIGVVMAAVDTTIVILALPSMERSLHIALSGIVWVVVGYLLMITITATQVGRLGDMFGRVRMYEAGFLVFIVGSALCAVASNGAMIIGFRALQGLGGAFVTANSWAVLADNFPPERRGRAYGFNAFGWNAGAILGILLGGVIITYVSWRWIFWINVPTGVLALGLAIPLLHDRGHRERHRIDWLGMVTLGIGLFCILWAMVKLATVSFSGEVQAALAVGVAFLVLFAFIERSVKQPMVSPSMFRIPTMTATLLASFFQAIGNFAVLFLVIMYLQGVRGLTPLHASLLLVPGYLIGGAFAPYSGRLCDRIGPLWPASVGLTVQIIALAIYAQLGVHTSYVLVVVASTVNGLGGAGFFPANTTAVMSVAPGRAFGTASGLLRTFSNVGMVFSFAVAILVAARSISKKLAFQIFVGTTSLSHHLRAPFNSGLHAAFYSCMGFMAVAAVLSATRIASRRRSSAEAAVEAVPEEVRAGAS